MLKNEVKKSTINLLFCVHIRYFYADIKQVY